MFLLSANAALHLKMDEVVHLHGVFQRQFLGDRLGKKPPTISARASSSEMPRLIR